MQPYFFPYIGYWQLINAVDTFVIYDDVDFIKKSYINRNNILIQGEKKRFTLELKQASQNKLINEIKVGDNKQKILKMIYMAYKQAPHFDDVYPIIEDILSHDERNLSQFIGYSLQRLSTYLGIDSQLIESSGLDKDITLKGQDKIIDICTRLGGQHYINAVGGQELYDKREFAKANIDLYFLEPVITEYKQFNEPFVPYLSIIDVMMFNSQQAIQTMLNNYHLV